MLEVKDVSRAGGSLQLLELPEAILTTIAQHISLSAISCGDERARGHPMLAVATTTRDAVLRGLRRIRLDLPEEQQQPANHSYQPTARLLHRACCEAGHGLHMELRLGGQEHALPELLHPALDFGGWNNVCELEVRSNASLQLLVAIALIIA
jgi:hypothetical protein